MLLNFVSKFFVETFWWVFCSNHLAFVDRSAIKFATDMRSRTIFLSFPNCNYRGITDIYFSPLKSNSTKPVLYSLHKDNREMCFLSLRHGWVKFIAQSFSLSSFTFHRLIFVTQTWTEKCFSLKNHIEVSYWHTIRNPLMRENAFFSTAKKYIQESLFVPFPPFFRRVSFLSSLLIICHILSLSFIFSLSLPHCLSDGFSTP